MEKTQQELFPDGPELKTIREFCELHKVKPASITYQIETGGLDFVRMGQKLIIMNDKARRYYPNRSKSRED